MSQTEAARQLGIPDDAPVYSGSMPLPEGWIMDWLGVRVPNPPPRPWPWPSTVVGNRVGSIVVQVWSRTVHRPGFMYTVLWHPRRGRTYLANGSDPGTMPGLVQEAQRVMQREQRGRPRRRPKTPQAYMADYDRIRKASGVAPSRLRMADEYGVKRDTVRRWLQRPDWRQVVPDKYRAE